MSIPTLSGNEFLVNTTTTGTQMDPSITGLSDGRFVVTWEDNNDYGGEIRDINAQVFNANGSKSGAEFQVNVSVANPQGNPNITALSDGGFVVSWDNSYYSPPQAFPVDVRAQVFNPDGSSRGAEFQVIGSDHHPFASSITALYDGRFVVAWASDPVTIPAGDHLFYSNVADSVRAQLFNADGSKSGDEFQVNTSNAFKSAPEITALTDGRFVTTWEAVNEYGGEIQDVRGQLLNADGSRSGAEFVVNTTLAGQQGDPSATALAGGRFVVTWEISLDGQGVYAQVFNADGSKSGAEFLVNTSTSGAPRDADITALSDGRFVVTWEEGRDVYAQVFNADGSKSDSEFRVNTTTTADQGTPSISALADGRFAVTWLDWSASGGDTSDSAVRGQIFDPRLVGVNMTGTASADQWVGTGFDDVMQGAAGNDLLDGGEGNDTFQGHAGMDSLDGGAGSDTASYAEKTAAVSVTLNGTSLVEVLVGGVAEDLISNMENIVGGSGADRLTGDAAGNQFFGGGGHDILVGLAGADQSHGGDGNDYLYMGEGNDIASGNVGVDVLLLDVGDDYGYGGDDTDYIFGGLGNDILVGEGGVDVLQGEAGNDIFDGGAGGDYVYGGTGNDTAYGRDGNDILVMEAGNDTAFGEEGQDYFYMGDGDDNAHGGAGVDVFLGGAGNDIFEGGTGVDYAWGEAGNDAFVIRGSSGVMVVNGFTAGGTDDVVRLTADTGITTFSRALASSTYYAGMNTTIVTVDADTSVWLVGVNRTQLTAADFAFV